MMRKESSVSLTRMLQKELDCLKQKSMIGLDLKVLWIPKTDHTKEGQVIGNTIYIYSTNLADALETLRHEFFDAMISAASKPYLELINALLSVISGQAYSKKEEVVESLVRMIGRSEPVFADSPPQKDLAIV
ncbi:hypothetical protein [Candidatus Nitrosotenuis uzonensis]|uniref:Uncharacterized protein n=1 Tax=Candidatus Nitrosotenuis uzonensis TaxID=1407055 RepID=V6ARE2_9ARCH|nr:hypothetical protein [Candidatus Nitrosotenuis uzonensis]CDI04998.1 hypothetical protein NITUZ_140073 [Candidatus Nitrosotenuis uzonensis]